MKWMKPTSTAVSRYKYIKCIELDLKI